MLHQKWGIERANELDAGELSRLLEQMVRDEAWELPAPLRIEGMSLVLQLRSANRIDHGLEAPGHKSSQKELLRELVAYSQFCQFRDRLEKTSCSDTTVTRSDWMTFKRLAATRKRNTRFAPSRKGGLLGAAMLTIVYLAYLVVNSGCLMSSHRGSEACHAPFRTDP